MLNTYTAALAKSNVAQPHRAAQRAYWDIASGTVTGRENQSFLLSIGEQHQHHECPMCRPEPGALVIAENLVPESVLEHWISSIDPQLITDTTADSQIVNSNTKQDLLDALEDLSEVVDEAEEKGYQIPSAAAISEARRLLETMYEIAPQRLEVYPMPKGEVTIDATNEIGHYVMLLIASDGSARSLTKSASGHSRSQFSSIGDITYEILRDSMLELDVSDG